MKTEQQINEQIDALTTVANNPPTEAVDGVDPVVALMLIGVATAVLQWVLADDLKLSLKGVKTS